MKRLVAIVASLAMAWPSIAAAAPPNKHPTTKPAYGAKPVRPGKPPGNKPPGQKPPSHRPPSNRPPNHKPPANRPPQHRPPSNRPGHKPPYWQTHKPRPHQYYRRGHWYTRIRGPVYRYPPGYAYRTWYPGNLFPVALLTSAFIFTAYASANVTTPPPGYRWVRYGPDLVLVNMHTNQVEDVVYGVFY